jgi:hypothetical protein
MPLIRCAGCGAVFQVALDVVGTDVECPKCGTEFHATVKMSGPRRKQKSHAAAWAAAIVLGLVGVFLGSALFRETPPPKPGPAPASAPGAPVSPGTSGDRPSSPAEPTAEPDTRKDPLRRTVLDYLEAVEKGYDTDLLRLVSFPAMQDRRAAKDPETPPWRDLDSLGQTLARKALSEELIGDQESRDFLAAATLETFEVLESTESTATVHVLHRSLVDDRLQNREIDLLQVAPQWLIVEVRADPIVSPGEAAARAAEQRRAGRKKRSLLGPIETVDLTLDTDAELRSRMERLADKAVDLSLGRAASAARRELVEIGKPAIPVFLNMMVGRDKLETPEERQVVNIAVQGLRDITLLDMGYAPGAAVGGMVAEESMAGSRAAMQRWFGWWRDHKDTWMGPEPEESDDDL